jgi:hypothetical protein
MELLFFRRESVPAKIKLQIVHAPGLDHSAWCQDALGLCKHARAEDAG